MATCLHLGGEPLACCVRADSAVGLLDSLVPHLYLCGILASASLSLLAKQVMAENTKVAADLPSFLMLLHMPSGMQPKKQNLY